MESNKQGKHQMLRLADKWYDRKKISHEITLIFEPHVHPFLRCNIWHIRGRDADLLIDTGLGVSSLKQAIADLIDKPLTAVATHIHYDHVGCLHEFDERVLHAIEAPLMTDYKLFSFLRMNDLFDDYQTHGDTSGYGEFLINAKPTADFDVDSYRVTGTRVTRTVDEGDVIDLGNRAFEVLHLPGHSPGSIGLWDQSSGTLFSGDALYDGTLLDELPASDIPDYIQTMKRLRGLPVEIVHGGHEPSFGQVRMIELIDNYLAWRELA
ncbi:MAG: MBL fold metallo-hydrolase [Pseudomonadota bacterium]